MTAGKKYTQFIFDDLENYYRKDFYGDLGLMYNVIKKLTELRREKQWAQRDLAKKSGIAQPNIARFESGRGNLTLLQVIKLARTLGYKISFEPAEFHSGDYEGYKE